MNLLHFMDLALTHLGFPNCLLEWRSIVFLLCLWVKIVERAHVLKLENISG